AKQIGAKAYLSLEERMACGMGVCLGCVVKTKEGYKRVCKEGPVFREGEILW
ncbi:MAG: dihydroorotate dehydrogenase, partial [Thermodesulfovibrionales bacterium]